ncbi:MAG: hypothetical protein GQ531_09855 [Sulfurovum sp.]|nr:hypothetical protein [Sulfurovum sp.]
MNKTITLLLILCSLSHTRDVPSDSKIQGRINIVNGASAECVMHQFYKQSGWIQIEGEIGRNGIDGLYYKKKGDKVKEVLVSESKWNTSRLGRSGKNKAVKQMSQEWVLRTMDKLIKKNPSMPYSTLKRFIENDQYRARLFRLKPISNNQIQITIYKIKNKGLKAFDETMDTQLKPIDINSPKNSFEIQMVQAYNECRSQYLHKYLSVLSDKEINGLLKDNYIQKMDIKTLLK